MIARITGTDHRLEDAQQIAVSVLALPSSIPWYTNMARAALALVAVQRGDVAAAGQQYAALQPVKGIMVHYIGADRVLGLLSHTLGKLDQAAAHFEDALAFCRKAGYRPELAWTCHDYADALLQRNGPGDRSRATVLLEEALAISNELGMGPLMERAGDLLERVRLLPTRAPAYPDGLTQREVEVLRLMAYGKSDREIADELFISSRTVTTHVSSILSKTSTANRTEAATYGVRNGLV